MCESVSYLCRLCLKDSEFRFSLFTGNILHKIDALASIKIRRDDKLPQTCCEACVANVYTSYKFQQCIIQSDKTLRDKLMQTESHIIEHAKQAPELFEVLHLEGSAGDTGTEVFEVEPKIENVDFNDRSDYVGYDCKPCKPERIEISSEASYMTANPISNLLQSSSSTEDTNTDLCNRNHVEYIDVDNFVDTLKTLEAGDVDSICDKFNMKEKPDLDYENDTLADPIDSDDGDAIIKLYKELGIKEKYKQKLEGRKKIQKADNSPITISSAGEVMSKLGIQNKFNQKLTAYREKQKGKPTVLECTDCDKKFETKRLLQRHMMKHKIEKCPFCFITMRSDNLKRHIQIHTDSPEVCEICGKIAKNKESLRGHVNYQHKNTATVKCKACNREFKSNHHYKAHERKVHLGIRNKQCDICGKKFFANHDLNKHINMTHRGARPYICPYCKRGFSSPYARKTHIRQHTLETPYRCEICAAGFRQKVSLVTHLKSKHSVKKEDNTQPE